jgi:hypothetical protein
MLARLEYRYRQARGSDGVMYMYVVLDQLYDEEPSIIGDEKKKLIYIRGN